MNQIVARLLTPHRCELMDHPGSTKMPARSASMADDTAGNGNPYFFVHRGLPFLSALHSKVVPFES